MQLKDFARRLPDEMRDLFEPISPPRIWYGNGRKPKTNQDCFHALMDVLGDGYSLREATGRVSVL